MIEIKDKKSCCGCGGCMNACPKHCITMKADNEGFLYPVVDKESCVNCGLCAKVCPIINYQMEIPFEQTAYLVQNRNEAVRRESTSGGAFTAIAQYVIEQGGVVFGAAYDKKFRVYHVCVEEADELWRFRNSKYVQSDTGETFSQVECFLKKGRMVCYSGTPCQIEGLKRYLIKDYEKLITVDVVCHAVPSPLVWDKYLEMQQERLGTDISNILFRDKHYGYKYSTMTIKDENGKDVYTYGIDTDPMLRAFFSNICDRPSCYECRFKKRYRVSDFTLWDCYTVHNFDKGMDDDKGTTRVLCHSRKADAVILEMYGMIKYKAVPSDKLLVGSKEMFESVQMNPRRGTFFEDAQISTGAELLNKYFPDAWDSKIKKMIRVFLINTGTYKKAKKIVNRLRKG